MDVQSELDRLRQQLRQRDQQVAEEMRRRREAEHQRDEEREQTRNTTLTEYLSACHELVSTRFSVETDKSLTTQSSTTNPRNKWCPTQLLPWDDFLDEQRDIFARLFRVFPAQVEAFETRNFLHGLGQRTAAKRVANHKDLEYVQHNSVEEPVRMIIKRLKAEQAAQLEFDIKHGVVFENHPNAISDVAEGPTQRRQQQLPPQTPSNSRPNLNQLRPDQICVYQYDEEDVSSRRIAFIVEYKPPHNLTLPHLRVGLRRMNIITDVVNRATKPTSQDQVALFQYHADRLVASAITQTFHYMIEGGLEYSYLTTGEAIVFLKLDWDQPKKLYYHLADPREEVKAHPQNFVYCTAVGQVLAFTLLALGSSTHGQNERNIITNRMKTWTGDFATILGSISADERKAPESSSAYVPTTYSAYDRSPCLLRWGRTTKKPRTNVDRPETSNPSRNRSPESSDDESGARMPGTPSPAQPNNRGQQGVARQSGGTSSQGPSSSGNNSRGGAGGRRRQNPAYCTQKCLLGLKGNGRLDEKCPNVARHRRVESDLNHPMDHATWLLLLRQQLTQTLEDGIVPLRKQGSRGVLFQITLLEYGYTFVSKATVPEFVDDLKHERAVYERLQPWQGICIPVFLGVVDLRDIGRTYYYDFRVRIIYMTFLSWAGANLDDADLPKNIRGTINQELVRSLEALHAMQVVHTDVRQPNALWSDETRRVMVIDFERAILLDPPRLPLGLVIPNKQAQPVEKPGLVHSNPRAIMQHDIMAARMIMLM